MEEVWILEVKWMSQYGRSNDMEFFVIGVDSNSRIVAFNRKCELLTGYSRDEVLHRKVWNTLFPRGTKGLWKDILMGRSKRVELPILTKNGMIKKLVWSPMEVGLNTKEVWLIGVEKENEKKLWEFLGEDGIGGEDPGKAGSELKERIGDLKKIERSITAAVNLIEKQWRKVKDYAERMEELRKLLEKGKHELDRRRKEIEDYERRMRRIMEKSLTHFERRIREKKKILSNLSQKEIILRDLDDRLREVEEISKELDRMVDLLAEKEAEIRVERERIEEEKRRVETRDREVKSLEEEIRKKEDALRRRARELEERERRLLEEIEEIKARRRELEELAKRIEKEKGELGAKGKLLEEIESRERELIYREKEMERKERLIKEKERSLLEKERELKEMLMRLSEEEEKEEEGFDIQKMELPAVLMKKGIIQVMNPSFLSLTGYSENELTKKSFFSIIDPDELTKIQRYYLSRLKGEKMDCIDTVILNNKKEKIPVRIKMDQIRLKDGIYDIALIET